MSEKEKDITGEWKPLTPWALLTVIGIKPKGFVILALTGAMILYVALKIDVVLALLCFMFLAGLVVNRLSIEVALKLLDDVAETTADSARVLEAVAERLTKLEKK
jgi:hypothetical protein